MQHHALILLLYLPHITILFQHATLLACFQACSQGVLSLTFFICWPLIMNETEVSEESWRSSDGIGPRVGGYTRDCARSWRGNREKVLQRCILKCSPPCKLEMSHTQQPEKPIKSGSVSRMYLCFVVELEVKCQCSILTTLHIKCIHGDIQYVSELQSMSWTYTFGAKNRITFPLFWNWGLSAFAMTHFIVQYGCMADKMINARVYLRLFVITERIEAETLNPQRE